MSIEAVSALLGHKEISTTQRYAHLADTQWEQVRDVLGERQAPAEPVGEEALRVRIAELAESNPEWAAVAAAMDTTGESGTDVSDDGAPRLPHNTDSPEGGKIVNLADFRRSTG